MAEQKEHLVAPAIYIRVLVSLMALLVGTVVIAFFDLDAWTRAHHLGQGWNTAIAVGIAVMKGVLIILFFMHVRYGTRLQWIFVAAGFVWLGIMLSLMLTDYLTRNHPPGVNPRGEPRYVVQPPRR